MATARSESGSKTLRPPTTLRNMSRFQSGSRNRFSITAQITNSRWKGKPSAVRRGAEVIPSPYCFLLLTRHCISAKIGRVPSIMMVTALPSRPSLRTCEDMKSSDGLDTSRRPWAVIVNTPTSETDPNLFFILRTSRKSARSIPSTYKTVSTICSRTRGPATSPDLVTWPTNSTTVPVDFAYCTNRDVHSRICVTVPTALVHSSSCIV
mmetsp:Transcript_21629/g.29783  ORF Transcript_21629/g.29783 Transcript_21629/m.29783 type:complete len:208 (-) Transcript_21629:206-829(-)